LNPDYPTREFGYNSPFVVSCELVEQSNHERPFDRANGLCVSVEIYALGALPNGVLQPYPL